MAKRKATLIDMVLALNESGAPLKKIGASPAAPIDPQIDMRQKQMQTEQMLESISKYRDYGNALKRATTMQEIGTQLAQIAELAEQAVVNEVEDSYDQHTLKRNMKEIKGYAGSFVKLAQEADMINQRMSALYEDMGRILERYFELPDGEMSATGQEVPTGRAPTEVPPKGSGPVATDDAIGLDETAVDSKPLELSPDRPVKEEPSPNGNEFDHFEEDTKSPKSPDSKTLDQLTLRAILSVHNRLKKDNPAVAKRFAKLSPEKMEQVVWKLVK